MVYLVFWPWISSLEATHSFLFFKQCFTLCYVWKFNLIKFPFHKKSTPETKRADAWKAVWRELSLALRYSFILNSSPTWSHSNLWAFFWSIYGAVIYRWQKIEFINWGKSKVQCVMWCSSMVSVRNKFSSVSFVGKHAPLLLYLYVCLIKEKLTI